jgi:hypothetical protein
METTKDTPTPDPIKAVNSAFDSVNLINKIITEPIDDNKKDTVDRNVRHLELMLTKEFFTKALTSSQKSQIEICITAGNNYIK